MCPAAPKQPAVPSGNPGQNPGQNHPGQKHLGQSTQEHKTVPTSAFLEHIILFMSFLKKGSKSVRRPEPETGAGDRSRRPKPETGSRPESRGPQGALGGLILLDEGFLRADGTQDKS